MINITLEPMTDELFHQYFKGFQNDPDMYINPDSFAFFEYDKDWVDAYILRQREKKRITFAIMCNDKPIGEILLKNVDFDAKECTLGIHLQNDSVKNRGIGTQAELLILEYAKNTLGMKTVYADALLKNTRSQHVLEKVGFKFIKKDDSFVYYKYE